MVDVFAERGRGVRRQRAAQLIGGVGGEVQLVSAEVVCETPLPGERSGDPLAAVCQCRALVALVVDEVARREVTEPLGDRAGETSSSAATAPVSARQSSTVPTMKMAVR